MYSWGNGSKGQLGTGSMQAGPRQDRPTEFIQAQSWEFSQAADTPQFITYPTDVLDVAAGEEHSACLIEGSGFWILDYDMCEVCETK